MSNTYITVATNSNNDVKDEFAQMYREHGLESLAKEVCSYTVRYIFLYYCICFHCILLFQTGIVEANNLMDLQMLAPSTTQISSMPVTPFIQPKQGFIQPKQGTWHPVVGGGVVVVVI